MTLAVRLVLLFSLTLGGISEALAAELYDYPVADPYKATIVGTPSAYQPSLPQEVEARELDLTPETGRPVPEVFWYQDRTRYSVASQDKPAPLIFVIAGTGSDHNGGTMQFLQRVFFHEGFHVICLPSPTHPNFIVTASASGVPGNVVHDSHDLYRVMERIWEEIKGQVDVTDFYLTGYSLGGTQAAFVAHLDEDRSVFDFKKVLMINPAVNLYNSVSILDGLLEKNIPGGLDNFDAFFEEMMGKFSDIYRTMDNVEFDETFLYAVLEKYQPTDAELAALIGLAFRFFSSNMVFTADVVSNSGFVVPKNRTLSPYESLTDYFKVTFRTGFIEYFDDLYYPFLAARQPNVTRDALINESSLASLEPYLKGATKIGLMTNEDDLIYQPGEVDFLLRVFGSRAKIYPRGGHCGNMAYRDNVEHMVEFFCD